MKGDYVRIFLSKIIGGGRKISNSVGSSVWELGPVDRGREIENIIGRSDDLAENFPKIDRFENGEVTSIKSIDLNLESYQDIKILERTVKGYIDDLAAYQGQPTAWSGIKIFPWQVKSRTIDLAIPATVTNQAQLETLQNLQSYAASKVYPVTLRIIPIP